MLTGWRMTPDNTTIRVDGSIEGMASIAAATPSREAIACGRRKLWKMSKTSAAQCTRSICRSCLQR